MVKKLCKKTFVLCIIILFIGASVTPIISGDIKKNSEDLCILDNNTRSSSNTDWWPMFHHDLQNSGYSTSYAPDTDNLIWSYKTGLDVSSSPAVIDNKVYVGSDDKNVYCLNADNGSKIWSFTTGLRVSSSPAVVDGKVYVGSSDNSVYCLNADNGSKIWRYGTGGAVSSSPAVADGKVYIGSTDKNVYCLDADDGSKIWSLTTGDPNVVSPAVVDDKVYTGSYHKFYCLDADDGSEIWNYTIGDYVYSPPAVVDGKVYFGSNLDKKVYCLDADDGSEIWNYTVGSWVASCPAVVDDRVYVGSHDSNLYCLDADDGSKIWSYATGAWVLTSPAVADGKVFFGSRDNNVYCVDADDGSKIWNYTAGYYVHSSPAVADGKLFIGSNDDRIYCFELENYPPNEPSDPDPENGATDVDPNADLKWTGGDPDEGDTVTYDVYFGTDPDPPLEAEDITDTSYEPGMMEFNTLYFWKIVATDNIGASTEGPVWSFTTLDNDPPGIPSINGPTSGIPGATYSYTFISVDPDGNDVYYEIDWGDGQVAPWDGPHESNTVITKSHSWVIRGEFTIKARAKDVYDAVSDWGTLKVRIPRSKAINAPFLSFLQHFSDRILILRYILELL